MKSIFLILNGGRTDSVPPNSFKLLLGADEQTFYSDYGVGYRFL